MDSYINEDMRPYLNLANAIVLQAVNDYRDAIHIVNWGDEEKYNTYLQACKDLGELRAKRDKIRSYIPEELKQDIIKLKNFVDELFIDKDVHDYMEAKETVKECERFFKSGYCKSLTDIRCDDLAQLLKTKVIEFDKQAYAFFEQKKDKETDEEAFKCYCGGFVKVYYGCLGKCKNGRKTITKYGYKATCLSCGYTVNGKVLEERKSKKS